MSADPLHEPLTPAEPLGLDARPRLFALAVLVVLAFAPWQHGRSGYCPAVHLGFGSYESPPTSGATLVVSHVRALASAFSGGELRAPSTFLDPAASPAARAQAMSVTEQVFTSGTLLVLGACSVVLLVRPRRLGRRGLLAVLALGACACAAALLGASDFVLDASFGTGSSELEWALCFALAVVPTGIAFLALVLVLCHMSDRRVAQSLVATAVSLVVVTVAAYVYHGMEPTLDQLGRALPMFGGGLAGLLYAIALVVEARRVGAVSPTPTTTPISGAP